MKNLVLQEEYNVHVLHFIACFSAFKAVSRWNNDLEYVVEKGDSLYKLQNTFCYLSCTDLPRIVQVEHLNVPVVFKENIYGTISNNFKDLTSENSNNELYTSLCSGIDHDGILFNISGLAFSIIECGRHGNVYNVDSNSSDTFGRPTSNGTAIISKFSTSIELHYPLDAMGRTYAFQI